jgi:secreted trypsin-like serine protease
MKILMVAVAAAGLLSVVTPAHAVVGGSDATTRQYPWMVVLSATAGNGSPSGQFCGGILVAPTKVVTAAHCIDDKTPADFQVIAGRADLRGVDGLTRQVLRVWNAPRVPAPVGEPKFMGGGDLSVLTLDKPLPYRTLPIAGPHDAALYRPGRPALTLGWGIYREEGLPGPSAVLQQGRFPMLDYATCNEAAKHHPALPFQLDPRFYVCGGNPSGGAAGCGGDSGGPLVIGGRLAGVFGPILSRNGKVCEGAYSGYTRVDAYAELIREQLSR